MRCSYCAKNPSGCPDNRRMSAWHPLVALRASGWQSDNRRMPNRHPVALNASGHNFDGGGWLCNRGGWVGDNHHQVNKPIRMPEC